MLSAQTARYLWLVLSQSNDAKKAQECLVIPNSLIGSREQSFDPR